jgi:tetratricopeptide (TPR) repeat protein
LFYSLRKRIDLKTITRLSLILLVFAISACATKKRKGDLSLMGKLYHNTTAKYNGYFNARELLKASFINLEAQHQDNYNKLLPVFPYVEAENPKAVAPDLDNAIEKVTVVVNLHRQSHWTDDCYLLVGQAQFLKQDYESAEKTLRYTMAEYDPIEMEKAKLRKIKDRKKRKKEERELEKEGKSYFMKHRPAYQEAQLWLAKTLIERDNYDSALREMGELAKTPDIFDDIKRDLAAVRAHFFIKRQKYAQALPHLSKAVELGNDRLLKARYTYIMAQIQQMQGEARKAYANYERCLKYRPGYDMTFSCKLNMAQSAYQDGTDTPGVAMAKLRKMLKDNKNADYKDQIYYAMAGIALASNDREDAIKNLELSLRYNTANRSQKAESYLTLGDLYFEGESFVKAKNYYDSTLQLLPPIDERYDRVQKLNTNLNEIAKNLEIIQLQDSLLRVSGMSDIEKQELALKIKKEQDAKAIQDLSKGQGKNRFGNLQGRQIGSGGLKESSFFAYDDKDRQRGIRQFQQEWGSRPLEDDWRRSNRGQGLSFDDSAVAEAEEELILTEEEIAELLGAVPNTPDEKKAAELKIQEAMYALGTLYRERLERNDKAIDILEELNERYPGSNFELDSWYLLYLIFDEENNSVKKKEYYDKIIGKYPTSTYAQILEDPNFADKLANEELKLNDYYDQAYAAFSKGDYQTAFTQSMKATQKFGADNALQPRFALLRAMCTGSLEGEDAYKKALTEVVAKYPDTPEHLRAKEMLRLLNGGKAVLPGGQTAEVGGDIPFEMEPNKLHYIIIVFNEDISLNDMKNKVSDYNRKYHKLDKLRISNVYLGKTPKERRPIVVVRRFKNKDEVMSYYDGIQKNKADFIDEAVDFDIMAVTQGNYREILKARSLGNYKQFFDLNYLN